MWSSIRGRFLITVAVLAAVLAVIVYYSELVVGRVAETGVRTIQDHRTLSEAVDRIKLHLQRTESYVFQYVSLLDEELPTVLGQHLTSMTDSTTRLNRAPALMRYPHIKTAVENVETKVFQLQKRLQELMKTLSHPETRYPATELILESLQPSNFNFIRDVNIAIDEATSQARADPSRLYIADVWKQLRYMWTQQVSTFRLMLANRAGIFGDPQRSMRINESDRRLFMEQVQALTAQLEQLNQKGELGFQQSNVLAAIKQHIARYENSYRRVSDIFLSRGWRADLPYLEKYVRPLLESTWQDIVKIEQRLNQLTNDEVLQSLSTSDMLTRFMQIFTGIIYVVLILGFLLFEYTIRRPMLDMARAMESEGKGESVVPKLPFKTLETGLLFDAFKKMQSQIHSRQLRLTAVLEKARDGIITLDSRGFIESFNRSAEVLFGCRATEVTGKHINELVKCERVDEFGLGDEMVLEQPLILGDKDCNVMAVRRDGQAFPMSLKMSELELQGKILYIAMVSDISETQAMIDKLRAMAERDALTGLYNRYFLMEALEKVLDKFHRDRRRAFAIMYVNLDHFKFINDTLGHQTGDEVLKQVAALLAGRIRKGDLLARIGADEFVVLLSDYEGDDVTDVAKSFQLQVADHQFHSNHLHFDVSCSVGVALLDETVAGSEDFLARSDIACQIAKQDGRNRVHVFCHEDRANLDTMSTDLSMARQIKTAIEQNRFVLACQPIVDLYNMEVRSYEVLVRMLDEEGQIIPPGDFLPSAERYGMMIEIDQWVFTAAIHNLAQQQQSGYDLHYSINLSAFSITEPLTLEAITRVIKESGVNPTSLTFEVTESTAIKNLQAARFFLGKIQALGCQTALDDFGAGYSSFAYLKELPVDYVKIDGGFVREMGVNRVHKAMVKSMNEVAHAMGKATVAEFVENEKILKLLKEIGVDMGQGFHLGESMIVTHFHGRSDDRAGTA